MVALQVSYDCHVASSAIWDLRSVIAATFAMSFVMGVICIDNTF